MSSFTYCFGLILVESFRTYGDAECGDTEPGIIYKNICILCADEGRDNKQKALYCLLGRLLYAAAVPGQIFVRD